MTDLVCDRALRRQKIRESYLNGIDYVDVVGKHLCVHFLTGIPEGLTIANALIEGGRRVRNIKVTALDRDPTDDQYGESCLGIEVDREGDFSTYTLRLVETNDDGTPTSTPLAVLDPRYAAVPFTFKIDCPADIDCQPAECVVPSRPEPDINYLAKDYATFRQLILDRAALLMPDWRERHVPDLGIALVELLAYTGDYLSYYQDAVATEQYLDTARLRISVRRHARLVDYAMHEGCNARAFIAIEVSGDVTLDAHDIFFVTRFDDTIATPALRTSDLENLPSGAVTVFEPLSGGAPIELHTTHNLIDFWTWGDAECCLQAGATAATLVDRGLSLRPGDFLLIEELACAETVSSQTFDGTASAPDADPTRRHVVRLTSVEKAVDALYEQPIVNIEWAREDALPFDLCISAVGKAPECDLVTNLAVARGNIVLADHGLTVTGEPLAAVPEVSSEPVCEGEDELADVARIAGRYRPALKFAPLTFAQPVGGAMSATQVMAQDPRAALPAVVRLASIPPAPSGSGPLFLPRDLTDPTFLARSFAGSKDPSLLSLRNRLRHATLDLLSHDPGTGNLDVPLRDALRRDLDALLDEWTPRADLIDSRPDDLDFVAEIDDDGRAHLRFGDGELGRGVEAGSSFLATYRVGNGRAGLVGAETIGHIVSHNPSAAAITRVRNPLASRGAVEPEPVEEVKRFAPTAFSRVLERAVTASDYAALARVTRYPEPDPRVQSSAAILAWNGSWHEADVAIDPANSNVLDPALQSSIAASLELARRMGHDVRVGLARYVPLLVVLDVCVSAGYLRGHVTAALREAFSSRALPGGRRGFFHPDNLTFGEAVYVSRIVAAARAVDGVADVTVVVLNRLRENHNPDLDEGVLVLAPNEVARLDNDAASPENGIFLIRHVRGGR
jgi:hypothetical protein